MRFLLSDIKILILIFLQSSERGSEGSYVKALYSLQYGEKITFIETLVYLCNLKVIRIISPYIIEKKFK